MSQIESTLCSSVTLKKKGGAGVSAEQLDYSQEGSNIYLKKILMKYCFKLKKNEIEFGAEFT